MDEATLTRWNEMQTLKAVISDYLLAVSIDAYSESVLADMKEACRKAQYTLKAQYGCPEWMDYMVALRD